MSDEIAFKPDEAMEATTRADFTFKNTDKKLPCAFPGQILVLERVPSITLKASLWPAANAVGDDSGIMVRYHFQVPFS